MQEWVSIGEERCGIPVKGVPKPPEGVTEIDVLRSIYESQQQIIDLTQLLVNVSGGTLQYRFDTGILQIAASVVGIPDINNIDPLIGYTQVGINTIIHRNTPVLYVTNYGPGILYVRVARGDGSSFSQVEIPIFEAGYKVFYDVFEIRVRSPVVDTRYAASEFPNEIGESYSTLNRPITVDALAVVNTYGGGVYPGNVLAAGGANSTISFDITGFANIAKLTQATVTQRVLGVADFTLEIWEVDTYNPATRADLYQRIWTRDYAVDEDSDIIDPITLYFDRDTSSELHIRLVNNAGGQASEFDLSFKAFVNPL